MALWARDRAYVCGTTQHGERAVHAAESSWVVQAADSMAEGGSNNKRVPIEQRGTAKPSLEELEQRLLAEVILGPWSSQRSPSIQSS